MAARLGFRVHQHLHDLRVGLLFVPIVFTTAFGITALMLIRLELSGSLTALSGGVFSGDAAAAQAVLSAIAGSMMAVISIVYSVLVVALSLASTQFSPRILGGYISDRPSQYTLGMFTGTFTYCLIVLGAIESDPPRVPTWAVSGSILLALLSIGFLIFFIHNIASGIQASHLVARIARRTERLVSETFATEHDARPAPPLPADATAVESGSSGYVQLFDLAGLIAVAERDDVTIHVHASPGDFVAHGGVLASVVPASRATHALERDVRHAFDLGATRTMQQDATFGIRQIVDCGLKAVSPAVNDPSTAVTCIDHIADLLVQIANRPDRPRAMWRGGALRLVVPFPRFVDLVDLGFGQLRWYSRTDLTVSMRLLERLGTIAGACRDNARLDHLALHARAIRDGFSTQYLATDREKFDARFADFERAIETARGSRS